MAKPKTITIGSTTPTTGRGPFRPIHRAHAINTVTHAPYGSVGGRRCGSRTLAAPIEGDGSSTTVLSALMSGAEEIQPTNWTTVRNSSPPAQWPSPTRLVEGCFSPNRAEYQPRTGSVAPVVIDQVNASGKTSVALEPIPPSPVQRRSKEWSLTLSAHVRAKMESNAYAVVTGRLDEVRYL